MRLWRSSISSSIIELSSFDGWTRSYLTCDVKNCVKAHSSSNKTVLEFSSLCRTKQPPMRLSLLLFTIFRAVQLLCQQMSISHLISLVRWSHNARYNFSSSCDSSKTFRAIEVTYVRSALVARDTFQIKKRTQWKEFSQYKCGIHKGFRI